MSVPAIDSDGRRTMNWEYVISGIIALALLVYLTYALLKPEKF
jgi:K+-transporting ATPase KdpF subunit